jgi:hypothetical protein
MGQDPGSVQDRAFVKAWNTDIQPGSLKRAMTRVFLFSFRAIAVYPLQKTGAVYNGIFYGPHDMVG